MFAHLFVTLKDIEYAFNGGKINFDKIMAFQT